MYPDSATCVQPIVALDTEIESTLYRYRKREGHPKAQRQQLEPAERTRKCKLRTRRLILMGSCIERLADRDRDLFELSPTGESRVNA